MHSERFTRTESAVILSLMRNPEHPDIEISRAMDMNLFTFNRTKNSLTRRGMLTRQYVPNYRKIGMEILSVSYGSGIEAISSSAGTGLFERGSDRNRPEPYIFGLIEGNNGVIFNILRDFTNLKRLIRIKENKLREASALTGSIKHSIFSFRDLRIERFFDVEDLLEADTGDREVPRLPAVTQAQIAASRGWSDFFEMGGGLAEKDLDGETFRVLLALVGNPDSREVDLMRDLGLSRYRLRKAKERLFKDGYIKPFIGTDIAGMGYEVLIFTHLKFKVGQDPRDLFRVYEGRMPRNMMIVAMDHTELIGLGIFKNLTEGSTAQMNIRKAMVDSDFLDGEPEIMVFSLPNCTGSPPLSFHRPLIDRGWIEGPIS